jgi:DNA-binding CsgD family transcriptional regulator
MADRDDGFKRPLMSDGDELINALTFAALDDKRSDESLHTALIASRSERDGCKQFKRLEDVLGEVMAMVRLRACRTDDGGGVLLDAVVGDVRCLCIQQEPSRLISLSPRQQQIAGMVAAGRTNHAIASSLSISVWTVSTHLRRIFAKLSVSSRSEMVAHLLAYPDFAPGYRPERALTRNANEA